MIPCIRLAALGMVAFLLSCSHVPLQRPPDGAGPVNFTVPGVDDVPDLWGDPVDPDLVVFFGGNEFMVVPELIEAFRKEYPQYRRVFCETLPPGVLAEQMAKGKLVIGNLEISLRPDVVTEGKERIEKMKTSGEVTDTCPYARNRLAIMVREGNPMTIRSLRDLQRKDVKVSMPDAKIEDIAKKIEEAYDKAGGGRPAGGILGSKLTDGSTFVTRIHHRQTSLRIVQGLSDAGPVWATEVLYQRTIGQPIEGVAIPEAENVEATSVAAVMAEAPHPRAARAFVNFLGGDSAQQVYRQYGFLPPQRTRERRN